MYVITREEKTSVVLGKGRSPLEDSLLCYQIKCWRITSTVFHFMIMQHLGIKYAHQHANKNVVMRVTRLLSPLWNKRYSSCVSVYICYAFFLRAYFNASAQRNKVAMGTLTLNSLMYAYNTTNVVFH